MRRLVRPVLSSAAALVLLCAGMITVAVTGDAPQAAAAGQPITLALITSQTGPAAAEFSQAPAGFLARIALQNAQGGVNGHKIVPLVINDETSPTQVVTAVQNAIAKGAFGIVSDSPLFFEAAKYPQQQGLPVTGGYFDGPEWGEQPYTNMFASDNGSVDPKYPANPGVGNFVRSHGGTNLGVYGYGISPSSSIEANSAALGFKHIGGKVSVVDTSIPFGGVDFTTEALVAKQKGVNSIYPTMDVNSNLALVTSLEQAGVHPKVVVLPTGYDPTVVTSNSWGAVQGDYFLSEFRPFSLPNAGTVQMAAALKKYQHFKPSQFPNYSQYESWTGADLMIKGLQLAGKNPTHAGVISALRKVKSYNANGLLPNTINYSTIFGHNPEPTCEYYMVARTKGFVPASTQPICGADIPGTTSKS